MKLHVMRLSIRAQLSVVVVLVAIISLGVLSFAAYFSYRNVLIDLRKNELKVIAQVQAAQITEVLGLYTGEVIQLTGASYIQSLLVNYYSGQNILTETDDYKNLKLFTDSSEYLVAVQLYTSDRKMMLQVSSDRANITRFPLSLSPPFVNNSMLAQLTYLDELAYIQEPVASGENLYLSVTRGISENNPGLRSILDRVKLYGGVAGYATVIYKTTTLENGLTVNNINRDSQLLSLQGNVTNGTVGDVICGLSECRYFLDPSVLVDLRNGTSGSVLTSKGGYFEAFGYATVNYLNVKWAVLVNSDRKALFGPLYQLRNTVLIAVFSIGFSMCVLTLILSTLAVKPITRLQTATEQTSGKRHKSRGFAAKMYDGSKSFFGFGDSRDSESDEDEELEKRSHESTSNSNSSMLLEAATEDASPPPLNNAHIIEKQESNIHQYDEAISTGRNWTSWRVITGRSKKNAGVQYRQKKLHERRSFRMPEEVTTRKYIKDELVGLTEKFNEMTAELRKQYQTLEDRVTERTKEIEMARFAAENALQAKSLFVANVTHELRTPLNGILGTTAVSMGEDDPQKISESLEIIFKSGELLLHLLTDLLTFPATQTAHIQLEEKEFTVNEFVTQLRAIFSEQAKAANINLQFEMFPNLLEHLEIIGDINRMLQVAINLISNALKFSPEGSKIQVTVKEVRKRAMIDAFYNFQKRAKAEADARVNSGDEDSSHHQSSTVSRDVTLDDIVCLAFEVKDNGPGIAPHLRKRIFEAFIQGDLAMNEKRSGAGLGLSICRQLANIMHGSVELESELGKGSIFYFNVPLLKAHGDSNFCVKTDLLGTPKSEKDKILRASSDIEITPPQSQKYFSTEIHAPVRPAFSRHQSQVSSEEPKKFTANVLVAEDNRVNQEVMIRMLKLEGIKDVVIANDGAEAVEEVKKMQNDLKTFDVIFMDIQMPNLDGRQATKIIRQELKFEGPIIAVSAYADASNIEQSLASGMNHFLAKPLRRAALRELLTELLHGKTASES